MVERVEDEKRKRRGNTVMLFLTFGALKSGREEGMEIKADFPFEHSLQIHNTMYISSVQPKAGWAIMGPFSVHFRGSFTHRGPHEGSAAIFWP